MNIILKWGGLSLAVLLLLLFCVLAGVGFWSLDQKQKTAEAIERINNRKITLADVMGENLPAQPNEQINNATVAGVDANSNAIRDDVELAIFAKYPNSAKIRAGMLQYAQALQLELTEVFNSETLVAVSRKRVYARLCIVSDDRKKEIDMLVINNIDREKKQITNLKKYMITYSVVSDHKCDIDTTSLLD